MTFIPFGKKEKEKRKKRMKEKERILSRKISCHFEEDLILSDRIFLSLFQRERERERGRKKKGEEERERKKESERRI